jgi:hypothetical protein
MHIGNRLRLTRAEAAKGRPRYVWTLRLGFARAWRVRLPVTLAATPVSAAAEQQHDYDDDQEQFHGDSPLKVWQRCWIAGPPLIGQPAQNEIFEALDEIQRAQDQIVPRSSTPELSRVDQSIFSFA